MDEKTKKAIDDMDYESMLSRWRNSPSGDPMFQGEVGDYFSKIMGEKKSKLKDGEHTQASKKIGW